MPDPRNVFLNSTDPLINNAQTISFLVVTNGTAPTAAISYTDGSGWATVNAPVLISNTDDGSSTYNVDIVLDANDYSVSGDNPRRATLTMTHSDTTTTDTNFIDQYGYNPSTDTLTVDSNNVSISVDGASGFIQITSSLATGDLPGYNIVSQTNSEVITLGDIEEVSGESYTHKLPYTFAPAPPNSVTAGSVQLEIFHQYNKLGQPADQFVQIIQTPLAFFAFNPQVANNEIIDLAATSYTDYQIPVLDNNTSTTEYKVKDPAAASYGAWDEDFLNSPTGDDSTWFSSVSVIDGGGFDKILQFTVAANATGSTREIDLGAGFHYIAPETIVNGDFSTTGTLTNDSVELGVKTYGTNNSSLASGALTVKGPYGVEFTDGLDFNLNSLNDTDYRLTYTITANAGSAALQYYAGALNGYQTIPSTVGTHNVYFKNLSNGYRLIFKNLDSTGTNSIVFSSVSLRETPMDSIKIRQISS